MENRNIFICWKWKDLASPNGTLHDVFPVEGEPEAKLVRMHERAGVDQILNWLKTDSAPNESDYLLLMHSSHFSTANMEQLSTAITHLGISAALVRFGGGNDYIYYKPDRETGLLDQEQGVFADEVDTKIAVRNPLGQILSERFNPLWRRYKFNLKQRLEKQSVLLYRTLDTRLYEGQTGTAYGLLTEFKPAYISELEECKSILTKHYSAQQTVMDALSEFWDKLHSLTLNSTSDLRMLQASLTTLLLEL